MQYAVIESNGSTKDIKYKFNIVNQGTVSVPLSELKVRYWFTDESSSSQLDFVCDYTAVPGGSGSVTHSFSAASGMNADHYLEVGFLAAAGSIAMGASSGEVQARFHSSNFQTVFTQANDYSFDPTKTSFQDALTVTLYANGTLIWGTEP